MIVFEYRGGLYEFCLTDTIRKKHVMFTAAMFDRHRDECMRFAGLHGFTEEDLELLNDVDGFSRIGGFRITSETEAKRHALTSGKIHVRIRE